MEGKEYTGAGWIAYTGVDGVRLRRTKARRTWYVVEES